VTSSSYQTCLESMFKLRRFGIKLGLETVQNMLAGLNNPHGHYRSIHVAGTNGKGSVATMLATILTASGYKVGRYTSPHLESFNERICINGDPISDDHVVQAYKKVQTVQPAKRQPTFFEYTTVMAFWEFARSKVDWAVIETGMGGRMDATNVVEPAVSVVTNISLEHRSYLGRTIAAIATEKAGIIKPGTPIVTAVAQPAAWKVISSRAAENNAAVYRRGRDFKTRRTTGRRFSYTGIDSHWTGLELSLNGAHQVQNASLVLAACELLNRHGLAQVGEMSIRRGLKESRWPGRLEVVSDRPLVILDGAHNLTGARTLSTHMRSEYGDRNITLVVGILNDKPFQMMLKDLISPCQRVIITQPKIDRAIPAPELAAAAKKYCTHIEIIPDVGHAATYAVSSSRTDDVICIAGSLYVVGEARTALLHKTSSAHDRLSF
jgi:dihydrofolate synthase / folylpolyglutamate synthase